MRELLTQETLSAEARVLNKYLKSDLLIIDDMGLKILPPKSGEILLEIIMRRYENRSTIMTSNRPIEEWGKLLSDVPLRVPSSTGSCTMLRLSPSPVEVIEFSQFRSRPRLRQAVNSSKPSPCPSCPANVALRSARSSLEKSKPKRRITLPHVFKTRCNSPFYTPKSKHP